ncbi:prolyl aminopeptidase [Telluria beijingensis]|uniref:prolyl aminopeptidase n=1 Tax=Telluria beijingensis TaxID=3068633 RepID=UPI002795BC08|nr:prolyl aminopeptidase [Massilia sp. REN29]
MFRPTANHPPPEPYRHGMLPVDALHSIYWEESGNPHGAPVLVLHGGPGAGSSPIWRQFFDPDHYRIVQFDQRGAGKSTPPGEWRANTTPLLVADIEALRALLGIEQWLVFGGSWGATLALAYGQAHPASCQGFILRSPFLCTREEIAWFFEGARLFHPELYAELASPIPAEERGDLLGAYARRLLCDDEATYLPAARRWSRFEVARASLRGAVTSDSPLPDALAINLARLEAHYFRNGGFFEEGHLLRNMHRIAHLPAIVIQGRHDTLSVPLTAFRVAGMWPGAALRIVEDGCHTALEPGMQEVLLQASELFKRNGHFRAT